MKTKNKNKKKTAKLKSLTINRKKWVRGKIGGQSALLNDEGNMCCLGFAAKSCGIPPKMLDGNGEPSDLVFAGGLKPLDVTLKLGKMVELDATDGVTAAPAVQDAIDINDDGDLTEAQRERKLKPILRKLGFDVKFVGPVVK